MVLINWCREFSRIFVLCIYVDFNIKYHAHYGEAIVRTMYIMGMTYYQPMREQENSDRD